MSDKITFPLGPAINADTPAVEVVESRSVWNGFSRVDVYRLKACRFSGIMSDVFEREIFSLGPAGQAAVILPYDPVRDVVVLIEQFRLPSYLSRRTNGWTLETVAGLIEKGDTPEDTARREFVEESGREIGRLVKVGHYMPSPGAFNETIHLFIGEVVAGEGGQIAGLADEHEDIRVHVLSFDDAMTLVDTDKIDNGNTLIALNWLARHRERLRKEWASD